METSAHSRFVTLLLIVLSGVSVTAAQTVPPGFTVNNVITGLAGDAVAFALLPDGRFIVANQKSATLDLVAAGTLTREVGMISDVSTDHNERGLLAVAVDSDWPDSSYVYTYQTMSDGYSRVLRFAVTGTLEDGLSSDLTVKTSSADTLLEMPDNRGNHNGGSLRFGPDRSLFVSLGDDGAMGKVQDLTTLNGKIVRISPDPGGVLSVPNPTFPNPPPGALSEIYAFGLRNPFRFNIDPSTGRLLIGDVGLRSFEEIDLSEGGENFGWPRWEANQLNDSHTLIDPAPTFPIFAWPDQPQGGDAGLGLLTYRQRDYPNDSSFPPEYEGSHFVSDYYYDPIWSLKPDSYGGWAADSFATGFVLPTDAAISDSGGVFILEYGNAIREIVYSPGSVIRVRAKAYLQGAYVGGGVMDTTLLHHGILPVLQPFADSTFDGSVIEFDDPIMLDTIPVGAVDWVLVDLRAGTAPGTFVKRQPGFLRYDGVLLGIDGEEGVPFDRVDPLSYHVILRHRNHAPVMSSSPIDFSGRSESWDFDTAQEQAYSNGGQQMSSLGDGKFAMFAGDTNVDGQFTAGDFNEWLALTKVGGTGYVAPDFNLDGQVLASDFNVWLVNTKAGYSSQIPE